MLAAGLSGCSLGPDTFQTRDGGENQADAGVVDAGDGAVLGVAVYCAELTTIADIRRVECLGGGLEEYLRRDRDDQREGQCHLLTTAVGEGRRRFDAENARQCLAYLRSVPCGDLWRDVYVSRWYLHFGPQHPCSNVTRPAVTVGGSCLSPEDCAGNSVCDEQDQCSGSCTWTCLATVEVGAGASCGCLAVCSTDSGCGYSDDPALGECLPESASEGESCPSDPRVFCGDGTFCGESQLCTPLTGQGGRCSRRGSPDACAELGMVCVGEPGAQTCQPFKPIGGECTPGTVECGYHDRYCAATGTVGVCRLIPANGEECVIGAGCWRGICQLAPDGQPRCVAWLKGRGEACQVPSECLSGICANGRCGAYGSECPLP